jgi:general secretion pathway protein C
VWVPRLLSLAVWAAVAGSAVYWVLSLSATPQPVPSHARVTDADAGLRGDLARLFGERDAGGTAGPVVAPPPAASSRFKVLGVVGSVRGGPGIALLSIDGKAPRAYRVGAALDADWVLQSVTQKVVRLAPRQGGGEAAFDLELAALPPAATGQLPGAGADSAVPAQAPAPQAGMPAMPGQMVPQMPQGMQPPMQIAPPLLPAMRPEGSVMPPDAITNGPGG